MRMEIIAMGDQQHISRIPPPDFVKAGSPGMRHDSKENN